MLRKYRQFAADKLAAEDLCPLVLGAPRPPIQPLSGNFRSAGSGSVLLFARASVYLACASDKPPATVHNVEMSGDKAVRRLKTYAGAQGYVYQYYFVGQRAALPKEPESPATEFVFDVTSDRKLTYAISVFLPEKVLSAWEKVHGRPLSESERYAAAKLRLFRAFDELEDVKSQGRRLVIDGALLEEAMTTLGVE